MSRIMAVDYGTKRVGIAVTDESRIIATGLATVPSHEIFSFLTGYLSREKVDVIVVGEPRQMNNKPSEALKFVIPFVNKLKKQFPDIEIDMMDERFTSKMAFQTMIASGLRKKDRQNKGLVDRISATIILQSYLEYQSHKTNS